MSRSPCDTCAFRPGSPTYEDEPKNRLVGMIAALGGIAFNCHYSPLGDWSQLKLSELNPQEHLSLRRELPICEGWKAEVKRLAANRHFRGETARIRRIVAKYALQKLHEFVNGTGEVKEEARVELQKSIVILRGGK